MNKENGNPSIRKTRLMLCADVSIEVTVAKIHFIEYCNLRKTLPRYILWRDIWTGNHGRLIKALLCVTIFNQTEAFLDRGWKEK